MSEPFLAEIKIFAGNFAPRNFAFCDGQLLAITQNTALFSLLGTTYGGDGRSTFGLPDLRGRIPLHYGRGPGQNPYRLGQKGGIEDVTLNISQLPGHEHKLLANSSAANVDIPGGATPADTTQPTDSTANLSYRDNDTDVPMTITSPAGGSRGHNNMMPYLCVSYIIALSGVYPSRN